MATLRTLVSIMLILFGMSCGVGSESKVSILEHEQPVSMLIVKNESGTYCMAENPHHGAIPYQAVNYDSQTNAQPSQVNNLKRELTQIDVNDLPDCNDQTLSALKEFSSGESQQASLAGLVGGAVALYAVCVVVGNIIDGSPWEAFCVFPAVIGSSVTSVILYNLSK